MSRRDGTTTKVFVGSLPAVVTPDDLRKLFGSYGKIVECDIANRCGFLHLEDRDLAEKAIEDLNNTNFMGVRISVERGRVKPPKKRRQERESSIRRPGGGDRGAPYSRDVDYGRGSRNGMGSGYGREYDYDRFVGYDRGAPPPRGYGGDYGGFSERRPVYDERSSRDYVDDHRGGYPSNGYSRSYDDRGGYADSRGGYDERRPAPYSNIDDRRPPINEHRSIHDSTGSRSLGGYERGGTSSNDMYSRRGDPPSKPYGDRETSYSGYGTGAVSGNTYSSSGGYGPTSHSYGSSSNTGAYMGNSNYGTGYDGSSAGGQNPVPNSGVYNSGSYGNEGAAYGGGGGGYSSGYGTATGSYGSGGGGGSAGYVNSSATYSSSAGGAVSYGPGIPGVDSYGNQSGYNDSYGGGRGSYDTSYSTPGRSLSSGGVREREPRRSLTSGADRRY